MRISDCSSDWCSSDLGNQFESGRKRMKKNELLDRMATGALSRRQFSKAMASAGLALTMVPMTARPSRAEEQVTYFTWTGYDVPEFFSAYVERSEERRVGTACVSKCRSRGGPGQ